MPDGSLWWYTHLVSSYPNAAFLNGGGEVAPLSRGERLIHWRGGTGVFVEIVCAPAERMSRDKQRNRRKNVAIRPTVAYEGRRAKRNQRSCPGALGEPAMIKSRGERLIKRECLLTPSNTAEFLNKNTPPQYLTTATLSTCCFWIRYTLAVGRYLQRTHSWARLLQGILKPKLDMITSAECVPEVGSTVGDLVWTSMADPTKSIVDIEGGSTSGPSLQPLGKWVHRSWCRLSSDLAQCLVSRSTTPSNCGV